MLAVSATIKYCYNMTYKCIQLVLFQFSLLGLLSLAAFFEERFIDILAAILSKFNEVPKVTCDCCLLSGGVSLNPGDFGIFTMACNTKSRQISSDSSFLPCCRERYSCLCLCFEAMIRSNFHVCTHCSQF